MWGSQNYNLQANVPWSTTTACFIQGESSGGRQISKKCELFLCSRRKRRSVVVKMAYIPFFIEVFHLKFIFVLAGRNDFRSFVRQTIVFFLQNTKFFFQTQITSFRSSRVRNLRFFIIDHFMVKSVLFWFVLL